jgi:hypothetical protein
MQSRSSADNRKAGIDLPGAKLDLTVQIKA